MSEHYIGLMSGTSSDGVDAVLATFAPSPRLHSSFFLPYSEPTRTQVLGFAAGQYAGDPIDQLGRLDQELGGLFAQAALEILKQAKLSPRNIRAIGSHGQTVRHHPSSPHPFTLQLADPNIIAARTHIATVADFRRRDMALGGQGAPLVPAFHCAVFADPKETRAVVNIGGIANLTLLPTSHDPVSGYDTGPGNILMDWWSREHLHAPHDENGAFAASGKVNAALLADLLSDEYFRRPPPKSTGREYFSEAWFAQKLAGRELLIADVMTTLCELTAHSIADALNHQVPRVERVLLCGGGVHNHELVKRLGARLPRCKLGTTAEFGIPPDCVEATAFAWLARETLAGRPGNLPAVTGARMPVVLGATYPA